MPFVVLTSKHQTLLWTISYQEMGIKQDFFDFKTYYMLNGNHGCTFIQSDYESSYWVKGSRNMNFLIHDGNSINFQNVQPTAEPWKRLLFDGIFRNCPRLPGFLDLQQGREIIYRPDDLPHAGKLSQSFL